MGDFIQWFVYQQDYLWFLTALGWAALLGAWWRFGREEKKLAWMPWAGAAACLTACLEVSQLVTPVVMRPFAAPWLVWDLALGGIHAVLAGGLWWVWSRQRGYSGWTVLPGLLLATMAASLRWWYPAFGAELLAAMALGSGLLLIRNDQLQGMPRLAVLAVAASVLLATNSPVTEWLKVPRRHTEISPWALVSALGWLVGLVASGLALYRQSAARVQGDSAEARADLRQLVFSQALWLTLGFLLASIMSHWARASFEQNLLSRVRLAAELIDDGYLESTLGRSFRVDEIYSTYFLGKNLTSYRSRYFLRPAEAPDPLPKALASIEVANPDIDWARIVTVRDGWLIDHSISSRMPPPIEPGIKGRYAAVDAAIWRSWSARTAEVIGPVDFYYGAVIQARAPLLSSSNRMLGWLTFDLGVARWLSAQVQARLLAFMVIALGSALLLVNWQQRVRERLQAAARREAETAQAASVMKTAFLAKVSHELRTPIQSLLGYSELLRHRCDADPKAVSWLASLQQHGELMTRLVNDLVDLSAVEAGAFQLAPKPISLADVLTQTVESFRPRADAKNLQLACFVDGSVPPTVSLDGERFRQVVINLIGNAVKFTDHGGIAVALRAAADSQVVLTVTDTGPGIPPAEQNRLFVAFSRLEMTAAKEGSGLGLALSAALCQAMGGGLQVESDGATGSRFVATFLAQGVATGAPLIEPPQVASLRGHRVLVVDDNPLVRELFVAFLTEQGALCAAAATGAEALAQAGEGGLDAIILDLALPDGDGTEFVPSLRAALPGVRLVGVSAHAGSADRARALATGMQAFLTKPVALNALATAVAPHRSGASPLEAAHFATAEALRGRLSRQFGGEAIVQRDALQQAIAQRDWAEVRALAHYLKNSAIVIRDDELFNACNGLEQAAARAEEPAILLWCPRCALALDPWIAPVPRPFSPSV